MKSTIRRILKEENILNEFFDPNELKSFTSFVDGFNLKEAEKKLLLNVVEQILKSVEIVKERGGTFIHINDIPLIYGLSVSHYHTMNPKEKYMEFRKLFEQDILRALIKYFKKYLEIDDSILPMISLYGILEGLYRKYFLTKKV